MSNLHYKKKMRGKLWSTIVFSTKGFCPNFITEATKLQGSNIKEKKKNVTAGSTKPKPEPNQKETTKRLAPGGTGT
jgi:hypothetical protein